MKPANMAAAPNDQQQIPSQQQPPPPLPPPNLNEVTPVIVVNSQAAQPLTSKSPTINLAHVQQVPLALTTQNQVKPQVQPAHIQNSPQVASSGPITQVAPTPHKLQVAACTPTTVASSPITSSFTLDTINLSSQAQSQPKALTSISTSSGQTALVIIPHHSVSSPIASKSTKINSKSASIPTTVNVSGAHVTLAASTQSTPIQLQAPMTTHITNLTALPMTAHQQSNTTVQAGLANRPPATLSIMPVTPSTIKQEPNKYQCCLFDNNVRCERTAGNASFNVRIQKVVQTKKMNFVLDPTVRHTYICEHHKTIINAARKSNALSRDTKTNSRNYTANNAANALTAPVKGNLNDVVGRQQHSIPHSVSLDLMNNQNRSAGSHAGGLNNMAIRTGHQLAYGHYQGGHNEQGGQMDVMMSGNFDSAGGDSVPTNSGGVDVDLQQLQVNTLRRYKRHFRVQTKPGLNKLQLAESLKSHFRTLPIIEKEAITYFVYIVKCYRNKLDHNPKAD